MIVKIFKNQITIILQFFSGCRKVQSFEDNDSTFYSGIERFEEEWFENW